LQRALFEEELGREVEADDLEALKQHEWRWFGLMSYWYASLNVVIEAWEALKLRDPIALSRIEHAARAAALPERGYAGDITSPKFAELLREGEAHVVWIQALHQEFVRFLLGYFTDLVVTTEQRAELRRNIEGAIH
jgi:hypothetical protein